MRSYQYFQYLEDQGVAITVKPLFNDKYLHSLYKDEISKIYVFRSYLSRLLSLFTILKYDKIVIEKELFPYFPAWFEKLMRFLKVPYIVDYDDAIFHNYDQHPNPHVRRFLGSKIDVVMKFSCAVIAGNEYLASRARKAGATKVFVIPTVIDLERYNIKNDSENLPIIIGWIGTKSTYIKHFLPNSKWIKKAIADFNVEFHVVGFVDNQGLGNGVRYFKWTEETEVTSILEFDVGIMPLKDTLWEKGKCSYKLIQYMACGLPVIASPVGLNNEVIQENVNGLFASDETQWISAIEKYVQDGSLRKAHGLNGRSIVEKELCLQVTNAKIYEILKLNNEYSKS